MRRTTKTADKLAVKIKLNVSAKKQIELFTYNNCE